MTAIIHTGDALAILRRLEAESVHCCVTSPPYWGLRDYGVDGQIGLEVSIEDYFAKLLTIFAEVHRVLRKDGTLWVNMGDTYASDSWGGSIGNTYLEGSRRNQEASRKARDRARCPKGLKPKDMIGQPWRLAFALLAAGWYLRRDIIWQKPCPMPESCKDRPTTAHEYLFLLSRSERYQYDADAIREPIKSTSRARSARGRQPSAKYAEGNSLREAQGMLHDMAKCCHPKGRNRRSVWTIASANFKGAHFATFPPKLVEPCILAGCPEGGTVLDPFAGSGTTGMVALQHHRHFIGIELNPAYADLARKRIAAADPIGKQQSIAVPA